jgi:hypothetical protein
MIRVSNRQHETNSIAGQQIQYVDRIVEVPIEVPMVSKPEIIYVDREIIKEVIIPGETVMVPQEIDLSPIQAQIDEIKMVINHNVKNTDSHLNNIHTNLDMQSRALIALKMQRDVDRNRRLMLIKRIRKEQKAHKKTELKLKLAIGASLIISIASLIVKL